MLKKLLQEPGQEFCIYNTARPEKATLIYFTDKLTAALFYALV